jgi:hypothetical protein
MEIVNEMNTEVWSHWRSGIRLTGVTKTSSNRHSSVGAMYANNLHIMGATLAYLAGFARRRAI